jgi:hypothetical protein
MPTSLQSLATCAPSGRSRPLLLEYDAYAAAVLRQGTPVPWTDLAALTGHVGQVHSLLDPDAVWLDVEALYAAQLADRPDLVAQLGSRPRPGFALRELLGDPGMVEAVSTALAALAALTRRPVVLDVPSPARWLARAHALAGTPLGTIDADRADTASMYLAEWLGKLGGLPVALLVLDARPTPVEQAHVETAAIGTAESLASYSSIANVVGHFEWGLALRDVTGVEVPPGEVSIGLLPDEFWTAGAEPDPVDPGRPGAAAVGVPADVPAGVPAGEVLLATVPTGASPERVLEQIARLR